jgi:glutamyl-tRNA reductase
MSTLLVKHLASKGCRAVTLLNRSRPRAEALAEAFPDVEFDIRLMPDLLPACEQSDVIFAASSSEEILVSAADLKGFAPRGDAVGGLRRFIDISVPRNIGRDVSEARGNRVFNVDDLKEVWALAFRSAC